MNSKWETLREVEITLFTCQPETFANDSPVKVAKFCETRGFRRNIHNPLIWKFKIWPAKYWLPKLGISSSLQNLRNSYGLVLFLQKLSVLNLNGGKTVSLTFRALTSFNQQLQVNTCIQLQFQEQNRTGWVSLWSSWNKNLITASLSLSFIFHEARNSAPVIVNILSIN